MSFLISKVIFQETIKPHLLDFTLKYNFIPPHCFLFIIYSVDDNVNFYFPPVKPVIQNRV